MAHDLRSRVPNIMALSKRIGSNYSHLHGVLKGSVSPSSKLAKRIEIATDGAVKAVWLLGLETPPAQDPPPADTDSDPATAA
jgi:hypothetical protein